MNKLFPFVLLACAFVVTLVFGDCRVEFTVLATGSSMMLTGNWTMPIVSYLDMDAPQPISGTIPIDFYGKLFYVGRKDA